MIHKQDILQAKSITDFVFIKVKSVLVESAGFIAGEDGKLIEIKLQQNFNPEKEQTIKGDKFNISGEVVAAPDSLSTGHLYSKYLGSPKYLKHHEHESIMRTIRQLPDYLRNKHKPNLKPTKTDTGEPVTLAGVKPQVNVGDRVYFHYNCLSDKENFAWREDDGSLVYKLHYSQLFCTVRDGDIIMLNGYVLVTDTSDDREVIEVEGNKVKGRKKGELIIIEEQEEKKGNKKAKYLTGILEHIGLPVANDANARYLEPGTKVIFRPNSQFKNTIEGKEYMVMQQLDLVASVGERDTLLSVFSLAPIGDYLMLTTDEQTISKNKTHVWDQKKEQQDFKPGEIFVLPQTVSPYKKLRRYGEGTVLWQGENVRGDWKDKRIMYEKSGFYMYLGEYDVALVREADVYGELIDE